MLPVLVAEKAGTDPGTGFEFASLSKMVTIDFARPSFSIGPLPLIVEVELLTGPEMKDTVPPVTLTGELMAKVFNSACVELNVQLETPEAFVEEQIPRVLPTLVLVALKLGTTPATPTLLASLSVTVTVEVATPFETTGPVPVIVE